MLAFSYHTDCTNKLYSVQTCLFGKHFSVEKQLFLRPMIYGFLYYTCICDVFHYILPCIRNKQSKEREQRSINKMWNGMEKRVGELRK